MILNIKTCLILLKIKLQKVSQTVTRFIGISFVREEFNKSGLSNLIDNNLGIRNTTGYGVE